MSFQAAAVAREGHVDEVLVIPEVLEGAGDAALVVIPPQAEVLCVHHLVLFNLSLMPCGLRSHVSG